MKYSVGYIKYDINDIFSTPMVQFETYKIKTENKHLAMKEYKKKYPNRNLYYFAKNS